MCTALHDTLRDLGKRVPRRFTAKQSTRDVVPSVITAVLDVLTAHVVDPSTRQRLQAQIVQKLKERVEADRGGLGHMTVDTCGKKFFQHPS
jgi:hypothetical protein